MGHDVFISYASQDQSQADAICAALEQAGYSTWIAHRDNDPGTPYGANIIAALRACRVLVLVDSESASKSTFVLSEVENAKHFQKPMIPVRIQNIELSDELRLYISRIHWLDAFRPPLEQHFDKLLVSTGKLLGPVKRAQPPSAASPIRDQHSSPRSQPSGVNWKPHQVPQTPPPQPSTPLPEFKGIRIFEEGDGLLDLTADDGQPLANDLQTHDSNRGNSFSQFGLEMPKSPTTTTSTHDRRLFRFFLAAVGIGVLLVLIGLLGGFRSLEGNLNYVGVCLCVFGLCMCVIGGLGLIGLHSQSKSSTSNRPR